MVPRWPRMVRRWPQDGPKMEARRSQVATKSAPGPLSDVAELHIFPDGPKWPKLASRVSEVRFLAGLGSTFAVLQLHQNSPPLRYDFWPSWAQLLLYFSCIKTLPPSNPPTLRVKMGTTKHSYNFEGRVGHPAVSDSDVHGKRK